MHPYSSGMSEKDCSALPIYITVALSYNRVYVIYKRYLHLRTRPSNFSKVVSLKKLVTYR